MKVALFFLGLVALGSSAPQPRKLFHEHFEDFVMNIINEVRQELQDLASQYVEYEEFANTIKFILTDNFKELIYEMESLPEFKAVLDFLERHNIDISYFIDLFNEALESLPANRARQSPSGSDLSSYINDITAQFPKDQLAAFFDQKMAEDEEFRTALQNIRSEEFQQVIQALFENETFQKEIQILFDNGIDINVIGDEILAIFVQN